MSEHWPVSNEGVGMPPQPLEKENARLREALSAIADGDIPPMAQTVGYVPQVRLFARAALGDQTEEAELPVAHADQCPECGDLFTGHLLDPPPHCGHLFERRVPVRVTVLGPAEEAEDG